MQARDITNRLRQELASALANPREIYGYAHFGDRWPRLNRLTAGLQLNNLVVVVARPGTGKSMWLADILPELAKQARAVGQVVRIITLEMTAEAYTRRMAAIMAEIKDPMNIRRGKLSLEEQVHYENALQDLEELPIEFLSFGSGMTVVDGRLTRDQAMTPGYSGVGFRDVLDFIKDDTFVWALDHIGLMKEVDGRDTTGQILDIINKLMWLSHTKATGLAVTHLNRQSVGKRATATGISSSDQVGRNADLVLAIQRPFYEAEKLTDQDQAMLDNWGGDPATITISKSRDGVSGTIPCWWDNGLATIVEWDTLPPGQSIPMPITNERQRRHATPTPPTR